MSRWMMPWRCALSSASAISVGNLQRLVERERPFLEARGERLALEMRHDQIVRAVGFADVVDAADVRMVQRGDRPRLALEPGAQIGIAGDSLGRTLIATVRSRRVSRALIDFAHPARAERAEDFVRTEPGAGVEGHACLSLLGFS